MEYDELLEEFDPYDVTCARCGKVLSCQDAYIEDGDLGPTETEWVCEPCVIKREAAERAGAFNNRR